MKKVQSSNSVKRSYKGYKQTQEIIADDTDITTSHEVLCNTRHTHTYGTHVQPLDTFQLFFSSNIHNKLMCMQQKIYTGDNKRWHIICNVCSTPHIAIDYHWVIISKSSQSYNYQSKRGHADSII